MVQPALRTRGRAVPTQNGGKQDGGGGISLIFARTDTAAWQDWIFPFAYGILFLRGRLHFHKPDGTQGETATAPSALVAYTERDFARLRDAGLAGAFLRVYDGGVK